ncbi:MAG TPA: hypothetical protein VHV51_05425 [Polyangiaceae bacterium]|jgi:hypothetical protein|nr:hypothetical protein [Polyangiaceae bacterium]
MAGRRKQILLRRGLGLTFALVVGVAVAAACSNSLPADVKPTLLRDASAVEASPQSDSALDTDAAGAPGSDSDANVSDAALAPVALGVTPIVENAADAAPSDRTLAELETIAAGSRARSLVVRLDDLLDATGAPSDATFADLAATAALYRARGDSLLFSIALADRVDDARPVALQGSWNSPELQSTVEAVIDRAYETFGSELRYLSFGSDVDRFLSLASEQDRSAFSALVESCLNYAKTRSTRPAATAIGVTFSAQALLDPPVSEIAQLLSHSEAAIVTDYPLDSDFHAQPVSAAIADLEQLADTVANGNPNQQLVIEELGYPSATSVQSSPSQQQQFYQVLFGALASRRAQFPFVSLYALRDLNQAECGRQAATFGAAGDPLLIAARCSLGFKTLEPADAVTITGGSEADASEGGVASDMTAKPAWGTIVDALSSFGRP